MFFKDARGREWEIDINVAVIARVRSLLAIDLLEIFSTDLYKRLMSDPVLLVNVIYAVCKPEADKAGVSDEEFGRGMKGDAIDRATQGLLEEIVSFSPSPKDRANRQKVLAELNRNLSLAGDLAGERLAKMIEGGVIEKEIRQALEKSWDGSGNVPVLSA